MYYEEKYEDGKWYYRNLPDGRWWEMSYKELAENYNRLKKLLAKNADLLRRLKEAVGEIENALNDTIDFDVYEGMDNALDIIKKHIPKLEAQDDTDNQ